MKHRTVLMKVFTGWALACACAANAFAENHAPHVPQVDRATLDYGLKPRQIAKDTWVIEGAVADFSPDNGCNIINTGFIATHEGVIVINTGPSRLYGEQQRKAIEKVSGAPILHVINLNLHPDYFFGNQAWKDAKVEALAGTMAGQQAEGGVYADNLYRMCGDWMKGTESTPATQPLMPGEMTLGGHHVKLIRLEGHTADDLVLLDETTGVLFAGGLVFADRVPTTPHAKFDAWQESLSTLREWVEKTRVKTVVPSHGPVHAGAKGIHQTSEWLSWMTQTMKDSATSGLDLSELLHQPVPAQFEAWAAQPAELHRSLTQWYPQFEKAALVSKQ
jgi:quinoprotein relay system zinc metallohydrolase 1